MKKRANMNKIIFLLLTGFLMLAQGKAHAYTVKAYDHSTILSTEGWIAGPGLDTGIYLSTGDSFTVYVDPNDLWNAGALPRWSNANGLAASFYATGGDESGQSAGTLIGENWGLWTKYGLSAPYGALVGELGGTYFTIGTNYDGHAPASDTLKLFYWDSNNGDNTGEIEADVRVADVPEPASLLMFGSGLIGLVTFARRRLRLA